MVDQIIRPADLPNRASPNASEKIPVDNGSNVAGATVESIVLSGRPTASQAEAEAGTDAVKSMSPLTSRQGLLSQVGVTIASKAQGDKADTALQSVIAGDNVTVDDTDPVNPVISAQGGVSDGDKGDITVSSSGASWGINDGVILPEMLDATQAPGLRAVIKDDTFVNVKDIYGVKGGNDPGDAAKIQFALDNAPRGSTLVFPQDNYCTDVPLVMSQLLNLKLHHSMLRGDFTNPAHDVLRIDITGVGAGDVRNMHIDGGLIFCNGGGNCAININSTPDDWYPHFETLIENGLHSGRLRAIRIGAANAAGDSNFNTIRQCNLDTQVAGGAAVDLDGCADGNRVLDCLIFGIGTGVRVNLEEGAFNTVIQNNGIVSRDGGVVIANGSRVNILGNQFEQQGGVNAIGSHILIQGLSYTCAGNIIEFNNFGGGGSVNHNIAMYNARGTWIDKNQFNPAAIDDIAFLSDSGFTAKYNTLGPNNWARGTRSKITASTALTDLMRRLILSESSECEGNRGFWKPVPGYANGWEAGSEGLQYMVDHAGVLRFEGFLQGGTTTSGTNIATLPAGARPRIITYHTVQTDDGIGAILFLTNGQINAAPLPASSGGAHISMSGISQPIDWMSDYVPGPL